MTEKLEHDFNGENKASKVNNAISILIVDDNIDYLGLTEEYLRLLLPDARIDCLTDPESVAKKIEENKYDVIVSDYEMPCMNGLELLKLLRNKGNNIPFIFFTRSECGDIASKAKNHGVTHFIEKGDNPLADYRLLAEAITSEVERKHSDEELNERFLPKKNLLLPE
ncbi:MAG: response regulator [Candidatus Odinarchaeota archaeon]